MRYFLVKRRILTSVSRACLLLILLLSTQFDQNTLSFQSVALKYCITSIVKFQAIYYGLFS
jgi:hypothetical protein